MKHRQATLTRVLYAAKRCWLGVTEADFEQAAQLKERALFQGGKMKASRDYRRGAAPADHDSDRFLLTKRPQGMLTTAGFAIRRAASVRKLALVLAGALALTLGAAGGASAAAPVVNEHNNFTDTFPDNVCGITGTSTVRGVDNFKLYADDTFHDTSSVRQVFTADNGKSVVIFAAGQVTGLNDPIQNADGTITFINTYKGMPEKLSIAHGPTLSRDAGSVTVAQTFLPLPNGDLQFVSMTVSGEHGPHPELDSDFELFCNVLIPALT